MTNARTDKEITRNSTITNKYVSSRRERDRMTSKTTLGIPKEHITKVFIKNLNLSNRNRTLEEAFYINK